MTKGELLRDVGQYLQDQGYRILVLNLVNMDESDSYNPFEYIRSDEDVVKLITNLIANTTPKDAHESDPFWTKAESMYLQAIMYYVWYEYPKQRKTPNFRGVLDLLNKAKIPENERELSELDVLMYALPEDHPALINYNKVKQPVKDIRLDKKDLTINIGQSKTLVATVSPKAANKKSIKWNSSEPQIATVSSRGIVKGISSGVTLITATATDGSGKKAICSVKVKSNNSMDTANVFFKDSEDDYSNQYWGIKTPNAKITFKVPNISASIRVKGKQFSYKIENEWIRCDVLIEAKKDIASAAACELKIREITSRLPYSLGSDYGNGIYILQDLPNHFPYQYDVYYGDGRINLDNIWYISIGNAGASYFYESSKHSSKDDLVYSAMIEEAYNYIDGVTIHKKVEVKRYNFIDYYSSLPTTIEKNQAEHNRSMILGNLSPDFNVHIVGDNYSGYIDFIYSKSFNNCLLKTAKLQ